MKDIKKIIDGMDKPLLIITVILFAFGLLNIVTASSQLSVIRYNSSLYRYFYKQLAVIIVGLVAAIMVLRIPTKQYKLWGFLAFLVVGFLAIAVTLYGHNLGGNKNWLYIGPIQVQPSEFAKPVVIVCLSLLFEKFYRKLRTKNIKHSDMIGWIFIAGLFFPLIIFTQSDYGTMIVLIAIFGIMFLASPILRKEKFFSILLLMVLGLIGILIMTKVSGSLFSNSQSSRFDFFDPCSKYESGGYQICNGFIAINSGGLTGVGIGESKQKSYIPESPTDSIFAIVSEEYGFIGSTIILLSYVIIIYRILKLASNSNNTIRGRYICLGVSVYLWLHIMINLGGLFGVMPLTGIPLPFLSAGGSFTLALIVSLAIVQRISIEIKNKKITI